VLQLQYFEKQETRIEISISIRPINNFPDFSPNISSFFSLDKSDDKFGDRKQSQSFVSDTSDWDLESGLILVIESCRRN